MGLRKEWQSLVRGIQGLDRQTAAVLVLCPVLVAIQFKLGNRHFFLDHVVPITWDAHRDLLAWGWWFMVQGVMGFVVPVLVLCAAFKRGVRAVGLGLGDWKLAGTVALCYLPLVIVGTWILSDGIAFQVEYPHYRAAVRNWGLFAVYHGLFLFYWLGWEYMWRGFILFGTARTFGPYAILIQALPFAVLHLHKPAPELALSILGGLALGALVWRCRSFWVAVPVHALQMLFLDLWCTLRLRTGADGIGLDALRTALTGY